MLEHEESLIKALQSEGVHVVRGGEGLPKMDQIAWNTSLVKKHIKRIAKERPDALILNQGSWTFPLDSVDAVTYFESETKDIARVVIFSYKDTQFPGLVAGMAVGGGLSRIGIPFVQCYGIIDKDPQTLHNLMDILRFYKARSNSAGIAKKAIEDLSRQKYLAMGGMALRMPTTTADVDQWKKVFGVTYEAIDQSEIIVRSLSMVKWAGKPGESDYEISDNRIEEASRYLWNEGHGKFDFSRAKLKSINKFVYQLSLYYAVLDICKEYHITFAGIKCQDELSARACTACIAAAFLNNDVGQTGKLRE